MSNLVEKGSAPSNRVHRISAFEKLDLIPGLFSIIGTAIFTALFAPFRGKAGAFTFGQHVSRTVTRKALRRFMARYIGKPFSQNYEEWSKGKGLQPESVRLDSGALAHWVGNYKTARYIVIYYHGGGFSLDGDHTHLGFWDNARTELASADIDVAFLFLEYTLVPHGTYPTQLCEAIEALNYVLTDLHRRPSEVILAGDSAGANLALGVLSQLMHPSRDLPEVVATTPLDGGRRTVEKLKGLVLVGPWVSFDTNWPSVRRNRAKDLVSEYIGVKWSSEYLGKCQTNEYAEPATAPAEWWRNARAEHVLAVAGDDEGLVDCIRDWVRKYQSVNPEGSTTFVASPHESHIEPIINLAFGNASETRQGRAIKSWLRATL